jgi:hypothetical protein
VQIKKAKSEKLMRRKLHRSMVSSQQGESDRHIPDLKPKCVGVAAVL